MLRFGSAIDSVPEVVSVSLSIRSSIGLRYWVGIGDGVGFGRDEAEEREEGEGRDGESHFDVMGLVSGLIGWDGNAVEDVSGSPTSIVKIGWLSPRLVLVQSMKVKGKAGVGQRIDLY